MVDDRLHILVIDDERALREILLVALDALRFRIWVAGGAPAALGLVRRTAFDLIVCSRVHTLVAFRARSAWTADAEVGILVLTRDLSRPWVTTDAVRFAVRPPDCESMRTIVTQHAARGRPRRAAA